MTRKKFLVSSPNVSLAVDAVVNWSAEKRIFTFARLTEVVAIKVWNAKLLHLKLSVSVGSHRSYGTRHPFARYRLSRSDPILDAHGYESLIVCLPQPLNRSMYHSVAIRMNQRSQLKSDRGRAAPVLQTKGDVRTVTLVADTNSVNKSTIISFLGSCYRARYNFCQ